MAEPRQPSARPPYQLVFTPEARRGLETLEPGEDERVTGALRALAENGWSERVERIERNKYRLTLFRHLLLFRVFDDKTSLLVELVARRSDLLAESAPGCD